MAGYRALGLAALPGIQPANEALGFLEATEAPYSVSTGNSASANVTALQNCINAAYNNNLACAVKGAASGYAINAALYATQKKIAAGIGGEGGGGSSGLMFAHKIIGRPDASGNLPEIVLEDGVPLSSMTDVSLAGKSDAFDIGQYHCMLWYRWIDGSITTPDPIDVYGNTPSILFGAVVRNIKFRTGANPSVVALNMNGAQYCEIADVDINAEGGLAGVWDVPGSGASVINLTVRGGKYGLIQSNYRPVPHLNAPQFIRQTEAGILMHVTRNGLLVQGGYFEGDSINYNAVRVPEKQPTNTGERNNRNQEQFSARNVYMVDSVINMTGPAAANTAVDCYDSVVELHGVYANTSGKIVHTGKPEANDVELDGLGGGYTKVDRFVAGVGTIPGAAINIDGVRTLTDGNTNRTHLRTPLSLGTPPNIKTQRALWSWQTEDIIHPYDDPEVVVVSGTINDNTADNSAALTAALAANDKVFCGRGVWYLKDGFTVPSGKTLLGAGQSQTIFMPSHQWLPSSPTDIITIADGSGTTRLQGFGVNNHDPRSGQALGNLQSHKFFRSIHVEGSVLADEVIIARHELFGGGDGRASARFQEPMLLFTGNASGSWHTASIFPVAWDGAGFDADYRMIEIDGKTSLAWLKVYDWNVEGGYRVQSRIRDSKRVYIGPLKAETGINSGNGNEPAIEIVSTTPGACAGITIACFSGNNNTNDFAAGEDALIAFKGLPAGVIVFGFDRTRPEFSVSDIANIRISA